ncbi:Clp1-domain-containing protein [Choiromyces venosus 120613-1]|uniref:Polynucleotide 5'-hydroxyl-kinase GRC3 n=1 Tax=Choiromyces venosus 120613-1 TaxID=1336337 RepID=A0A3N4K5W9_9PEZI|nr:Clp1-domain-containing protein [Choiromyces venosus 120613-1]
MSVPGLQLSELPIGQPFSNFTAQDSTPVEPLTEKTYEIAKFREWRFEVAFGATVEVKLLKGSAEIFGTELPIGHKFTFTGTKSAIFTWHGCTLEVRGTPSVEYTSEETPMTAYTNLHFALEKLRGMAGESATAQGPRVMIIGPENAGKTSLVKILTAYAVRQGRKPAVVNLDPKEGVLSLPGTLSATSFSTIMDVEEGFGSSPTSGPSPVPVKLPLVYYYGLETPEGNAKLYKALVSRMAVAVSSRLSDDDKNRTSGIILDTPGTISQTPAGYDLLHHAISEFSITTLVVLGSERLYSDMLRRFEDRTSSTSSSPLPHISIIKLSKSGGCVDRDETFLRACRERCIREYFFGEPKKRTLSPYTMTVGFDDLNIWRVGEGAAGLLNTSLLPIGHGDDDDDDGSGAPGAAGGGQALLVQADCGMVLQHSVAAVLHAELADPVHVLAESSVMGFVYIASVDEQKRYMKILAPMPGRLPPKPLVVSSFPEPTFSLVG